MKKFLLVGIVFLVLAGSGVLFLKNKEKTKNMQMPSQSVPPNTTLNTTLSSPNNGTPETNGKPTPNSKTEKTIGSLTQEGIKIIDKQSFPVEMENWGKVKFFSGKKDSGKSSASFYLANEGDKILYSFPEYFGNDWGSLSDIRAVAFKDVNKDGLKDVIIIAEFMTGVGPTGATPFPIASVYFQKDKGFVTIPELDKEINKVGKNETVDILLNYITDKKLELK